MITEYIDDVLLFTVVNLCQTFSKILCCCQSQMSSLADFITAFAVYMSRYNSDRVVRMDTH